MPPAPKTTRTSHAGSSARVARILALDYGRKRIGIAISDELGLTAQPVGTLARKNRRADMKFLREIVHRHGVSLILVGHPIRLDGSPGEMAQESARFAARLAKELRVKIELLDERLTSWEARETLREAGISKGRRGVLDDVAAAVLLREYLERNSSSPKARSAEKA
ncbi:MAG: Holliday junction resolvase RuvX [Candidatus Acidiferrales bacterium]